MTKSINYTDLDSMQTRGRLVASKDNQQAFESAAEDLAVVFLEDDAMGYTRLRLAFLEGARNNCDGQYHLNAIESRLRDRVNELLETQS